MATPAAIVGRDRELKRGLATLRKGTNLLITGRAGIGKTALLAALYAALEDERPCLWIPEGTAKEQSYHLAKQAHQRVGLRVPETLIPARFLGRARREGVHWHWIARSIRRMPSRECVAMVADSLATSDAPLLVCMESLELPPSQAEQFAVILEVAQVAAGMDSTNRRERIRRLLWRFPEQERIDLRPLSREASRSIAEQWLDENLVRFESPRVRSAFLRAVEQDSGDLNKALKMAEKSAHIDATLRMAGLSEVFTQDLEDMAASGKAANAQAPSAESANPATETPAEDPAPAIISEAQRRRLEARISELGLDRERVKDWLRRATAHRDGGPIEHFRDLPFHLYERIDAKLEEWAERAAIQAEGAA